MTEASKHFLDRSKAYDGDGHAAFGALDPPIRVLADEDEWGGWDAVGDPVLHIEVCALVALNLSVIEGALTAR